MPKFYCDYCDVFLTNDSISVRKLHNKGWKHKTNVRAFYAQFVDDPTSALMVSTTHDQKSDVIVPPTMQTTPMVPLMTINGTSLVPGIVMLPGMVGYPATIQQQQQEQAMTSQPTTATTQVSSGGGSSFPTAVSYAAQQMNKTPDEAFPPFPDPEFKPSVVSAIVSKHENIMMDEDDVPPPVFLLPPPPPPHLLNMNPNIPLKGAFQLTAPPPPFPFVLMKEHAKLLKMQQGQ